MEDKLGKGLRSMGIKFHKRKNDLERKGIVKKGFTLIELIVVMAVIAILVLVATPKFLGLTEKASKTQIKSDIKTIESSIDEYLITHDDLSDWGPIIDKVELDAMAENKLLHDTKGRVETVELGNFAEIPEFITELSSLSGTFYANQMGKVYYKHTSIIAEPGDNAVIKVPDEAKALKDANVLKPLGLGTDVDPYQIWYLENLAYMDTNIATRAASYKVMRDLDFNNTRYYITSTNQDLWTASLGWKPIGLNSSTSFKGKFDGNKKTLTGLFINRTTDFVGLFGYVMNGSITHFGIANVEVSGGGQTGGLVGLLDNGTIANSHTIGNVTGNSYNVGGLVGYVLGGKITNSYATGIATGINSVGGLAGYVNNMGEVVGAYAKSVVIGGDNVGGLLGVMQGPKIDNSFADGNVDGNGAVGGLIGKMGMTSLTNSHATGVVSGKNYYVGGLVGKIDSGVISSSYAIGDVTGTRYVGGLVGYNNPGSIEYSYATGNVTSIGDGTTVYNYVGGLVGSQSGGRITCSFATGEINGVGDYVGGLGGSLYNTTVTDSYATGNVDGRQFIGGLFGTINAGSITNTYAIGTVTGTQYNFGGFIGEMYNGAVVSNSYRASYLGTGYQGTSYGLSMSEVDFKSGDISKFNSWDGTIWNFTSGQYPKLAWEK